MNKNFMGEIGLSWDAIAVGNGWLPRFTFPKELEIVDPLLRDQVSNSRGQAGKQGKEGC